jgi:CotH kinase protein/Chitobiase/beta-hexosaminidase C-terminal domain
MRPVFIVLGFIIALFAPKGVAAQTLPRPLYSHQAGFYNQVVLLELQTLAPNSIIRYTTDGDSVTEQSKVYDGPIHVTQTMVVRACLYPAQGGLPGPMVTNTYIMFDPTRLPVVSLSVVPRHFWSNDEGIYMFGTFGSDCDYYPYPCANFWKGWEKPLYVEMFDSDRQRVIAQHASVEITGGWSKANPKKGMLIGLDHDAYGDGTVHNLPIFEDKPHVTSWKKLHLRPGGNGATPYYHQDAWLQRAAQTTHNDYMAYRPVHVLLNGEYWGIYELRERQDQHFVRYNHGVDDDFVDVIRFPSSDYFDQQPYEAQAGTMTEWLQTVDAVMGTPVQSAQFYERMEQEFDLDNYIDYFAYQTWVANNDWLGPWRNNLRIWRPQTPNGRWRYMLWDLDASAGEQWDPNTYPPCINSIRWARDPDPVPWAQNAHSDLFNRFLQNRQCAVRFANRYADLLNTTLRVDSMSRYLTDIKAELRPEIQRTFDKWGGDMQRWEGRQNNSERWLANRMGCIRQLIVNECQLNKQVRLSVASYPEGVGHIRVNSTGPWEHAWSGIYFDGAPLSISVTPQAGWEFVGWLSEGTPLTDPLSLAFEQNFDKSTQLTAYFVPEGQSILPNDTPVRIYPNPVASLLTVQSNTPLGRCRVLDVHGRERMEVDLKTRFAVIATEALETGVYFLVNESGLWRFVKQ